MKVLSVYSNCSLGGMTSVYRTRALSQPDVTFDHIFLHDKGGRGAFEEIANANVRIVNKGRVAPLVNFLLSSGEYRQIRITSNPWLVDEIKRPSPATLIYEFHSPDRGIVSNEITKLNPAGVDQVWAPSDWAVEFVKGLLPRGKNFSFRAVPNLIDKVNFNATGPVSPWDFEGKKPISWIGRLENLQKNYLDFLRIVKILPGEFIGLVVVSLEDQPDRIERFLGEAALLGVEERIRICNNIPQTEVSSLHRAVRDAGGVFLSTALSESFGYAVYEAGICGCPVVSYDVGPLSEHPVSGVHFVPVGDLRGAANTILAATQ